MRSFSSRLLLLGLVLAMSLAATRSALAVEGLFLSWNDCPLGPATAATSVFACDDVAGERVLVAALRVPQAVDSVIGVEVVVDIQHGALDLPDWWHFEFGGCRADLLTADIAFGSAACNGIWSVPASGGVLSYTPGMPRGQANQARIRIALAVPSDQGGTMNASDIYNAARIVLPNDLTVSGCDGCAGSACLVLNSILIRRPPRPAGVPTTDILVTLPGGPQANWAWWQAAGECQAVPARNRTWGQIKALYR